MNTNQIETNPLTANHPATAIERENAAGPGRWLPTAKTIAPITHLKSLDAAHTGTMNVIDGVFRPLVKSFFKQPECWYILE